MTTHDTLNLLWCSSQSMAVHSSGHSIAVQSSGPSMAMMHGGQGAGLVGPLQDKLNRLLLSSNSPSRPSTSGGLIPAGRYDNVSSSLSSAMRVRSSQCKLCIGFFTLAPQMRQVFACPLTIRDFVINSTSHLCSGALTLILLLVALSAGAFVFVQSELQWCGAAGTGAKHSLQHPYPTGQVIHSPFSTTRDIR